MSKITDLTALAVLPAAGDLVPFVDVSDTTDSANGTTTKVSYQTFGGLFLASNVRYVSGSFSGFVAPFYSTVTAAIAAASSGDLIYVLPGTYSAAVTLVDGVNIHLCAGATLSGGVITPAGACSVVISGEGVISSSAGRAFEVDATTTSGTIIVFAKQILATAGAAVWVEASSVITLRLFVTSITTTSANSVSRYAVAMASSGSTVFIYNSQISTDGTSASVETVTQTAGTMELINCTITRTGGNMTAVTCSNPTAMRIRNSRIVNTNDGTASDGIELVTGGLVLSNVEIVVTNATAVSIDATGAADVVVYGNAVSNRDKDANVTVRVGTLTVDSTYVT